MSQLYLIRHAEAAIQVNPGLFESQGDIGLTKLGMRQAEDIRDYLLNNASIKPDIIISSTLNRAIQTAKIIAEGMQLPVIEDMELQEQRLGETYQQFMTRASNALGRITQSFQDKEVIIVTHGGIVDCSLLYFFGVPIQKISSSRSYTLNASFTHWEFYGEGEAKHWCLLKYNDTCHLTQA